MSENDQMLRIKSREIPLPRDTSLSDTWFHELVRFVTRRLDTDAVWILLDQAFFWVSFDTSCRSYIIHCFINFTHRTDVIIQISFRRCYASHKAVLEKSLSPDLDRVADALRKNRRLAWFWHLYFDSSRKEQYICRALERKKKNSFRIAKTNTASFETQHRSTRHSQSIGLCCLSFSDRIAWLQQRILMHSLSTMR